MRPWEGIEPSARHRAAYAEAERVPFWLDDLDPRDEHPPLAGVHEADLVIVGGGYAGLWTALHAKRDDPSREVVVLESQTCGWGASGRNGGFVDAVAHPWKRERPVALSRRDGDARPTRRGELRRHGHRPRRPRRRVGGDGRPVRRARAA